MTRKKATLALGLLTFLVPIGGVGAQAGPAGGPEARLWFDQGDEPVVERGDRLRLYYRTSDDAYVAILHVDTDGIPKLVFPRSPEENHYVRGGRDYRLLFPRTPYWLVEDSPGIGYFFLLASPEPFDFSALPYSYYDGGWDLSRVGRTVYRDPYVAMDEYVASLVPDWEVVPYALDFSSYHVDGRHDYPRFLCYDCHGFRPYSAWNPYFATCTSFQVVVYDDPYFYPSRRYRGQEVVWVRPPDPGLARYAFKERPAGVRDRVVVQQRPTPVPGDRTAEPRRSGEAGVPALTGRPAGDVEGRPSVTRWRDPDVAPARPATGSPARPATGSPARPATGSPARPVPGASDARRGAEPARRPADALRRPGTGAAAAPTRPPPEAPAAGRPTGTTAPARGPVKGAPPVSPPASRGGDTPPPRPVLRRRPSGGSGTGSGSSTPVVAPRGERVRPAVPVVGGERRPAPRPAVRPGGSSEPPPSRPSASGARPRPSGAVEGDSRPRASGGAPSKGAARVRPPARSPNGTGQRAPVRPARPSSSPPAARARPATARGGATRPPAAPRPAPRVRSGGASAAPPPVRSGGSSGARPKPRRPGGSAF